MAASQITARFRGRDYIVLHAPACVLENLKCTVCQQLLSEPVSTVCRHFFCEDCVRDLSSCPKGCKKRFKFSPDIGGAEQLINSLTVKCPNSTQGCEWQGQLRDAQKHLANKCIEQQTDCPYSCGEKMTCTSHFEDHVRDHCPNRAFRCPYCGHHGMHKKVTSIHYTTCENFLLPCPGKCDPSKKYARKEMEKHLCSECPKEYVTCKYSTLGCKKIVKKREMNDHLADNSYHITTCKISKEVTVLTKLFQSPDHTVSDLSSLPLSFWPWLQNRPTCYPRPPWVVKLEGFDQALKNGGRWLSEPFYSHYGGYKMCLCVHQKEDGKGEGTLASASAHLMKGDNDENLKFPFRATVTVSLLNQKEDGSHYTKPVDVWLPRNTGGEEDEEGLVTQATQFIYSKDLGHNAYHSNIAYLRNDTLLIRIDKILIEPAF